MPAAREAGVDSSTPELLDFSTFLTNEPRMSMKTKDSCGKLANEAGMSMKKRHLALKHVYIVENKGT
jgi:hypothetical protein